MLQAGISNSGIPEDERLELAQVAQVSEAGIGDPGTRKVESLEPFQSADLGQTRVGDAGTLEIEDLQVGEGGQEFKTFIGDIRVIEMQFLLQPEHTFIDCFGRVVDCKEDPESDSGKYRISVSFELVMDADRESLIQYNFRQQSLALKRRRLEKEEQKR